MRISDKLYAKRVADFLRSDEGKAVWNDFEAPIWFGVILTGISLGTGLAQLLTIRWTLNGIANIRKVLTLHAIKGCQCEARKDIKLLRPLICHGVINNPHTNLGVVLGSFRQSVDHDRLAAFARKLSEAYAGTSDHSIDSELLAILRDDNYRPYRRRSLPERLTKIPDCLLFDVDFDSKDGASNVDGTVQYAFVAIGEEKGEIAQIPWSVAAPCVG